MPISYRFLIVLLMCLNFGLNATARSVQAASANLVIKPYLQQLTDTSVIILWTTQTGASPEVRYAADTSYSLSVAGASRTVVGTQQHRVELTGLQPSTTYYYKVFTESEDLVPDEALSFQTAPSPGSNTPFTFIVFGDFGSGSDSQARLRDQMELDTFDFLLTTGDNAYDNGDYVEFQTKVFQVYQNLFSRIPIFPTLGNHDYITNNGEPYLDFFDLPQNAWRSNDVERYYSFDYGNVHIVALDSNAPLDADDSAASDDMYDWLRDDLSQATQPWKIVAFHHGPYSIGPHSSDGRARFRLSPIFETYGVDLVFNGHDHIYQRTLPLLDGQITTTSQGGIVYIVSGAGSAANYPCGSMSWVAVSYCSKSYGIYARVSVNDSSLTVEAIDENGDIKDGYALSKTDVAVESVTISGPAAGLVGMSRTFTAMASPVTATLPITYMWQATAQSPVTNTGGLANSVAFTWVTTETQAVTVTAINALSTVTNSLNIEISPVRGRVYLPITLKNK